MNAIQIIEAIKTELAENASKEAILAVLEDGAALATLGVTDADQEAVEDAYDMIKNAGLNFTLNEKGQKELLAEIKEVANENLTNPTAYFSDAEESADRWNSGEDASIEIEGKYTKSGNPEIISLQKDWFDAELVH